MTEQKKKIIKSRVVLALHEVLGRRPTEEEIKKFYLAARVLYSTIVPAFWERQQQKEKIKQLSIL